MSVFLEPLCWATTAASAIFPSRQSIHLAFHMDQGSNFTMAERGEFDLFAYIFNRDGEEDQPSTERQKEDVPLVDLTVDSDEDGASNSTAAVIQQDQPQRTSRQPRRTQIGQLPEPATDSEEEQNEDEEQEKQRGLWSIEVL